MEEDRQHLERGGGRAQESHDPEGRFQGGRQTEDVFQARESELEFEHGKRFQKLCGFRRSRTASPGEIFQRYSTD